MSCEAYNCNCEEIQKDLEEYNAIVDEIDALEFSGELLEALQKALRDYVVNLQHIKSEDFAPQDSSVCNSCGDANTLKNTVRKILGDAKYTKLNENCFGGSMFDNYDEFCSQKQPTVESTGVSLFGGCVIDFNDGIGSQNIYIPKYKCEQLDPDKCDGQTQIKIKELDGVSINLPVMDSVIKKIESIESYLQNLSSLPSSLGQDFQREGCIDLALSMVCQRAEVWREDCDEAGDALANFSVNYAQDIYPVENCKDESRISVKDTAFVKLKKGYFSGWTIDGNIREVVEQRLETLRKLYPKGCGPTLRLESIDDTPSLADPNESHTNASCMGNSTYQDTALSDETKQKLHDLQTELWLKEKEYEKIYNQKLEVEHLKRSINEDINKKMLEGVSEDELKPLHEAYEQASRRLFDVEKKRQDISDQKWLLNEEIKKLLKDSPAKNIPGVCINFTYSYCPQLNMVVVDDNGSPTSNQPTDIWDEKAPEGISEKDWKRILKEKERDDRRNQRFYEMLNSARNVMNNPLCPENNIVDKIIDRCTASDGKYEPVDDSNIRGKVPLLRNSPCSENNNVKKIEEENGRDPNWFPCAGDKKGEAPWGAKSACLRNLMSTLGQIASSIKKIKKQKPRELDFISIATRIKNSVKLIDSLANLSKDSARCKGGFNEAEKLKKDIIRVKETLKSCLEEIKELAE